MRWKALLKTVDAEADDDVSYQEWCTLRELNGNKQIETNKSDRRTYELFIKFEKTFLIQCVDCLYEER